MKTDSKFCDTIYLNLLNLWYVQDRYGHDINGKNLSEVPYSSYFNNFSIVLAILHAELHAYLPQTHICYMQTYIHVPQNHVCSMQSSKCSYVKFRKNFGELFHNFGELFIHLRNKI